MISTSNQPDILKEIFETLKQRLSRQPACASSLHHLQRAIDYFCQQGNATLAYLELIEAMRSLPADQDVSYYRLESLAEQIQRG